MREELMPCPFCGGSAAWIFSLRRIVCLSCESSSPSEALWNMRTIVAQQSRAIYSAESCQVNSEHESDKPTPGDS